MVPLLFAASIGFVAAAAGWLIVPRVLRSRHLRWQVPSIVAAAGLAAMASSHATAWVASDLLWRVVLGVLIAAAAAYARPLLLVPAVAGLAVGADGLWGVGAAFGAGTAIASVASGRRSRPLGALAGAGAAVAALHLDQPSGRLAAVLGAGCLAAIAAAGVMGMSRRRRRRVIRRAPWAVVPLAVLFCLGAVSALSARAGVEQGVRLANRALGETRSGEVEAGEATMRRASAAFGSGRRALDAWWARPARGLPVLGVNLDVAATLSATGADLSAAGATALDAAAIDELRMVDGAIPIERVAALRAPARESQAALTKAAADLVGIERTWLAPPLADRLVDLETRVSAAKQDAALAVDLAEVLPPMLGAGGPRRYFLAVLTPSELRGSGGIIGNYGEIVADNGQLTLTRLGTNDELNAAGEAERTLSGPDEYLGRYARFHPARYWQNATMSPDFPTVAGVVAELYPQSGGQPLDGVIAVDPIFLARLLELIGPVEVPGYPVTLTAENAERELLFEQYTRFGRDERVEVLGDAADAIWGRLTSRELPGPRRLGRVLGPAVEARHLQIASLHAGEQPLLNRLGISGAVPEPEGDFLGVVTQNASGNKIDWFLDRSYDYDVTIDRVTGSLAADLHLELRNRAPTEGLPRYIIGPFPGIDIEAGVNRMMLSLHSPWALEGATINGRPLLMEASRELDRFVYSTFVDVPAGTTAIVDARFSGMHTSSPYRLNVLRQPVVRPDSVTTTVRFTSSDR